MPVISTRRASVAPIAKPTTSAPPSSPRATRLDSPLPAHAAGFRDRGVLREGAAADVVVYDMEELDMDPRWIGEVVHDLPAGEWRRVQRARGYKEILVNGETTFSDGECTGVTPGRLLRHGRG